MAKVLEEVIVVKLSRLVKAGSSTEPVVSEEIVAALEQVVQELVGNSAIVEVEKA